MVSTEIIMPDGGSAERNALWNAAEQAEKRKDARTAREWIVALPAELDAGQRAALARSFGAELSSRYGVAVDIAIHLPDREGDNRNHHAHILTTTRQVSRNAAGEIVMGDKATVELSDKKRRELGLGPAADEVSALRKLWEQHANRALEQAGRSERIDARSLKAQGIDREATTHLGPVASEMERRGVGSDRGDGNRQAQANNGQRAALSAQIIDLKAERERRERERQVKAIPAADLVKQWDAAVKDLAKGYRQRADRLESRIRGELDDIGNRRWRAEVDHAEKRPAEVQDTFWNRMTGKVAEYAKALTDWEGTMKRIQSWKREREGDLKGRLKRLEGYLSRTHYGYDDKATRKAEQRLQRERPEWGARIEAAREKVAMDRLRQQEVQREAQGMAKKIVEAAKLHQKGKLRDVPPEFGKVLDAVNAMPGHSSQKAHQLAAELVERPELRQTYAKLLQPHTQQLSQQRGQGLGR